MNQAGDRLGSWLPTAEFVTAAAAGVLWTAQGGWVDYTGVGAGAWPLALLALMWGLRWVAGHRSANSHPDAATNDSAAAGLPTWTGPLLLFLATATVSLWAAYDLEIAAAKGWLMIGALGVYWALAHQPDLPRITAALALLQLAGVGIAGFFMLTQDWRATPFSGTWIARLAQAVGARLPDALASETLNANVAGGMLLVVLPLSIPLIAVANHSRTKARGLLIASTITAFALTLTGWFFTGSRGAHATLIGTGCLWLCGRLSLRLSPQRRWVTLVALGVLTLIALGIGAGIIARIPASPAATTALTSLQNRLWLWQLGLSLVGDAPFTGIGLGMFEMPFALYALLIHVGFVQHAHNLLLNIAIEQGVLGAVAFGVMTATAFWWGLKRRNQRPPSRQVSDLRCSTLDSRFPLILESALASLATILIHGLIDDPLYSSRGILLLLVPLGLLAASERALRIEGDHSKPHHSIRGPIRRTLWTVGLTLALTVIVIGGIVGVSSVGSPELKAPWSSRWQAAWHANLGVLSQAKIELTHYDQQRFAELSIDVVRRQEDLSSARRRFSLAAAMDPGNATARRRLTMIMLAAFDYTKASDLMQTVWRTGHRDRVTRLLYADTLVAQGRVNEAASVAQGLPFAEARLRGQAWGRYQMHDDLERAGYARHAALLVQKATPLGSHTDPTSQETRRSE